MDFPRLAPPHVYAGRWSAPGSPREFGGKSPPGAPKVRRERDHSDRQGMTAVLTQKYALDHKLLAHYSRLLDSVMHDYFSSSLSIDKGTFIMMGALLTLSAEHSVFAVIQKRKSTPTM
ncbi:hypothetical protein NDU88_006625 [Pleurodeles waltl]|uniref:Uncharacterized protein n=1 Tax=Pleurodeles waltl TaxID=8319 RepID=A0AAV7UM10_PLEWA|nr:hypothetical protein NDU88_006625 [Pleurodeles waltl]